jgi:hypothetical protein
MRILSVVARELQKSNTFNYSLLSNRILKSPHHGPLIRLSSVAPMVETDNRMMNGFINGESLEQHRNQPQDDSGKYPIWTPRMTKIVGTIGPASEQLPMLQQLVDSGLRVMRLNFSHATVEEVELRMKNLKLCKVRPRR